MPVFKKLSDALSGLDSVPELTPEEIAHYNRDEIKQDAPQAPAEDHQVAEVATIDDRLKAIARLARAAHKRTQTAARQAVLAVVDLGEHLTAARELLANHKGGSYGRWLKSVPIPRSTAHLACQVWDRLGGCPTVGQLDLSAAYSLSSQTAPQAAVDEVLELTADGRVDRKTAREIIAKHKPRQPKHTGQDPVIIRVHGGTVAVKPTGVQSITGILLDAIEALRDQEAA